MDDVLYEPGSAQPAFRAKALNNGMIVNFSGPLARQELTNRATDNFTFADYLPYTEDQQISIAEKPEIRQHYLDLTSGGWVNNRLEKSLSSSRKDIDPYIYEQLINCAAAASAA